MTLRDREVLHGPFRVVFQTPDGQMELLGRAHLGPMTNPLEDPNGLTMTVDFPSRVASEAFYNLYKNSVIRGFVVDAPAAEPREAVEKQTKLQPAAQDTRKEILTYDLRPPRVYATQWFKNGDHPGDSTDRLESHYVWYHTPVDAALHDICPECDHSWHAHGYLASAEELKIRAKIRSAAIQGMNSTAKLPPRDPSRVVCPGNFLVGGGNSLLSARFDRTQNPHEFHSEYILNPDPQRK